MTISVAVSFLSIIVVTGSQSLKAQDPIVTTPMGTIQGHYIKSYNGRTVSAFEGVPYAIPPIGHKRFKEPEPTTPRLDVLTANSTYVCLQYLPLLSMTIGSEDCLYLYIYVPRQKITGTESMSVVVHIHGGAFMVGSPKEFAGPEYITDKDIVYVSFNYRLGVLGFLSTEDDVVPGNNGLKDQVMALKWIQQNIKYFGGNPNSVTITGLSAGSASVHYHYLSPLSKGLFHRGLSQSGTALNPWALIKNPLGNTKKLASFLNCTSEVNEEIIECLKKQEANKILPALENFFVFLNSIPFSPFGPVIETGKGAFLPEHPFKLLRDGKINDHPWITSNTKNEAIFPVGYEKLEEVDREWDFLIPILLEFNNTVTEENKLIIARKIREFYLGDEKLSISNICKLLKLFTDRSFFYDTDSAIRLHAKVSKSPVYYYRFEYKIKLKSLLSDPLFKESAHSDDGRLLFKIEGNPEVLPDEDHRRLLFKIEGNPEVLPDEDRDMMNVFIDFIYNFATKRKLSLGNTEWNPIENGTTDIQYMKIISPTNIYMDTIKELAPTDFWRSLSILENEKLYNSTIN